MALINCPECDKEVSEKVFKCPNCGVVINKPKRGITGVIFNTLFILFNSIMILWIGSVIFFTTSTDVEGSGAAAAIGTGMLIGIWIFVGLPLALMNYLTRPKAYE